LSRSFFAQTGGAAVKETADTDIVLVGIASGEIYHFGGGNEIRFYHMIFSMTDDTHLVIEHT